MVRLAAISLNRLRLQPEEMLMLSPRELFLALQDYGKCKIEEFELYARLGWEQTRFQLFSIHNMNPHRKKSLKKPEQFMKFEWDRERQNKEQSVDEMREILKALHVGNYKKRTRRKR